MLEALWSIEFRSSTGAQGAGIVVLETGRVLGGDSWFTIIGEYRSPQAGQVEASVQVKRYKPGSAMIFGNFNQVDLKLSGKAERESIALHGYVVGNPQLQVEVRLARREELP